MAGTVDPSAAQVRHRTHPLASFAVGPLVPQVHLLPNKAGDTLTFVEDISGSDWDERWMADGSNDGMQERVKRKDPGWNLDENT